ncbi:MAG: TolC family protein [Myxococcota bacterium]
MKRVMVMGVALLGNVVLAQPAPLKAHLESAETQNVDRQISIEQKERARAEYRQAWTSLLPALTASGGWTHNQYDAVFDQPAVDSMTGLPKQCQTDADCGADQTCGATRVCQVKLTIVPKNQLDANLRFELPLINTTTWMRSAAANASQEAAAQRELSTRDQVRRSVVTGFYGYVGALAVLKSAKKSLAVAEEQARLTEIRYKAGAVTELETLRANAEVARNKQVVADAETLVVNTRQNLTTVSGLAPAPELEMPEDDLRPEPGFEELSQRVENLPGIKAADLDAQAAGHFATASRLALIPMVSAQFTERFTNATGFQGSPTLYNLGITFAWRLDVPMFQNMAVQSHLEQTARLGALKLRLFARDTILADWQRFNAALVKIDAARAQVNAAQRAAQVARDRYNAGAATQLDLIAAERDLFGAEVNLIQARGELAQARLVLRISAGLPLEG